MPTGQLEQFNCDGCGKSYRWKAELAGKRVKCKCGHAMTVPQPPIEMESDDPFGDALSAMAEAEHAGTTVAAEAELPRCPSCASVMTQGSMLCTQCGFNVNTGKKAKSKATPVAMGVGGADGGEFALAPSAVAAVKQAAAPGGVLAYAGMPVRRSLSSRGRENAGDNNIGEPFKDLILPIALFLLGVVTTFCEARYGRGIASVPAAMAFTGFTVLIDLVLVFAAIMIAVRLVGLGLGPIGPALLKIAAVSVLPGAVAGMLFHVVGVSGFFIVWIVSLGLTYGMFMGLLGLDVQETMICTSIIWVVRTWIGYAIVFAILSGIGLGSGSSTGSSGVVAAMSGPSANKLKAPRSSQLKVSPAPFDAKATAALNNPEAMEARAWVAAGTSKEQHGVDHFSDTETPASVIDDLYAQGAVRVVITRTKAIGDSEKDARQFVITLPTVKEERFGLFAWGRYMVKKIGGTCPADVGQKYLLVDLDGTFTPTEAELQNQLNGNNEEE